MAGQLHVRYIARARRGNVATPMSTSMFLMFSLLTATLKRLMPARCSVSTAALLAAFCWGLKSSPFTATWPTGLWACQR
jgi:hypothetical protein